MSTDFTDYDGFSITLSSVIFLKHFSLIRVNPCNPWISPCRPWTCHNPRNPRIKRSAPLWRDIQAHTFLLTIFPNCIRM